MKGKTCNVCKETKALEDFGRMLRAPDGKNYRCKACNCAQAAKHAAANVERRRARDAAYHAANGKSRSIKARRWYDDNHPKAAANRIARSFRGEQIAEAVEFVRANPKSSRRAILLESGLAESHWYQIKDYFALERIRPIEKGPLICVYSLKSIYNNDNQPMETSNEPISPRGTEPAPIPVPKFGDLSSRRVEHATAGVATRVTLQRVSVSRFSSEYDD